MALSTPHCADSPPAENERPHLCRRGRLSSPSLPAPRLVSSTETVEEWPPHIPLSSLRSPSPLLPRSSLASSHCPSAPCDTWVIPGVPHLLPPVVDVTSAPCPHLQSAYPPAAWPPGRPIRCPLDTFTPPHLVPRKHLGPHSLRTELRSIAACPGGAFTPQQALHPQPLKAKPKGSASSSFHPAVQSHWQTLGALPPDRPPHHPPTESLCLPPKPADSPADPSVTSKMQLGSQASSTTTSAVSPTPGLSGLPTCPGPLSVP